jgi:hypothetical protein
MGEPRFKALEAALFRAMAVGLVDRFRAYMVDYVVQVRVTCALA